LQVWRISRREFAAAALSGFGAAQRGGRWNSRGVPVVYTSQSQSLALLELLVHADKSQLPEDLVFTSIDVADGTIVDLDILPAGWNAIPHGTASQQIGDTWCARGTSIALRVPSVIVPRESNVLLNPLHPDFSKVKSIDIIDTAIDLRLF